MQPISIAEFSEWVDNYRPHLAEEQFKNQALRKLQSLINNNERVPEEMVLRALTNLHRSKHLQAEFEPAIVSLMLPKNDEAVRVKTYRGEHGKGAPLQSKLGSLSFGSKEVALQYAVSPNDHRMTAEAPRLIEAEIRIDKPIILDLGDPFIDGSILKEKVGLARAWSIMERLEDHLGNTDNFGELQETYDVYSLSDMRKVAGDDLLDQLYVDAYPVFDDPEIVGWFREAGYDGVIHGGNGESAMEMEYKVFDASQVKILSVVPAERGMFDKPEAPGVDADFSRPRI